MAQFPKGKLFLYFLHSLIPFVILVQCNGVKFSKSSLDGHITRINRRPYVVMIYIEIEFYCTGVLLDNQLVLAAAHCFKTPEPLSFYSISYLAGHSQINLNLKNSVRVDKIIIHEKYNHLTLENDIALLKGHFPLKSSPTIQFLGLPDPYTIFPVGKACQISGWSKPYIGQYRTHLLTKTVKIFDHQKCRFYWRLKNNVTEKMICANDRSKFTDVCVGDTGGPLMCNGKLAGFISWGSRCHYSKEPAVYTFIFPYISWLEEQASLLRVKLRSKEVLEQDEFIIKK